MRHPRLAAACLVGIILAGLAVQRAATPITPQPPKPSPIARAVYGTLPLAFEGNRGQTDPRVRFLAHAPGSALFLTATEIVLALGAPARDAGAKEAVLRIRFLGGDPDSTVATPEELPGKANYFTGADPARWITNVPLHAKVVYRDVYPGIDVVFYGAQGRLEYDVVVRPGGDLERVRLGFEGADDLRIDEGGNVVARTAAGDVTQHAPAVYQETEGGRRTIAGRYALSGDREVAFAVEGHDPARPLVIDPVVSYATYLGGNTNAEEGRGIAVDAAGNAYVTGFTWATNFPTTAGALQTTKVARADAFVTKLDATGSVLVYSTYLGGAGSEGAERIVVDAAGHAYVAGTTYSPDFPTTAGAFQTVCGCPDPGPGFSNRPDGFVAKLAPSGSALVYSTFLGGSEVEVVDAIAIDAAGAAYVTGGTGSSDFPVTPGAFRTTPFIDPIFERPRDGFVAKLAPSGSALVYATFLGTETVGAFDIAIDPAGNAYVTGFADSNEVPTTEGAYIQFGNGTFGQPYVLALDASGSSLIYGTFLEAGALGIAVDTSGSAYVVGTTMDSFLYDNVAVTKLNAAGSALVYSTSFGGSGQDVPEDIAIDRTGAVYLTGWTGSTDFPTTDGRQRVHGGGYSDAFVAKLDANGALVDSSYLGGAGLDNAIAIAVDALGDMYVTGWTASPNFPVTPGAFDTTLDVGVDGFAAKLAAAPEPLFLHVEGASLFLDANAPTDPTVDFRDSASLKFGGGNPWKTIGTWAQPPSRSPRTLRSLSDARVWLGLKSSDDQGTRFDLRAEVLKNGAPIATGEAHCVSGVTRNPAQALEVRVPFDPVQTQNSHFGPDDALSLRISARIGTNAGFGNFCGGHGNATGLRLYFDAASRGAAFGALFRQD